MHEVLTGLERLSVPSSFSLQCYKVFDIGCISVSVN